ncbi:MAG: hypothetical protein K9N46_09590 [Candidatus Marinimicrobia bacterium]|nr:hypothetical protein [Candidatus Neomarinimicrobiota bacterium]MCF7828429.1 hypothetical protein [Candidatus Neomarinimicrobiota bacterium]MCF7880977.1 hypothetical protein [Candidatus Neomarinimicrobiota bacterium]
MNMLLLRRSFWIILYAAIITGVLPLQSNAQNVKIEKDLGKIHLKVGFIITGQDLQVKGDTVSLNVTGEQVYTFFIDEIEQIYFSNKRSFNSVGAVTGGVVSFAAMAGLLSPTISPGTILMTVPSISAAVGILTGYLTPRLLEDAGFDAEHWQLLYSRDEPAKKNNDE